MKKEILTKKTIEEELSFSSVKGIKFYSILLLIPLALTLLLVSFGFSAMFSTPFNIIKMLTAIIVIIIVLIFLIASLMKSLRVYNAVKNNSLQIITDKLANVQTKRFPNNPLNWRYQRYSRCFFRFEKTGEWLVKTKNYQWSENYSMDDISLKERSEIGDEFYVVVDAKGKILIAYNKKLFELKE